MGSEWEWRTIGDCLESVVDNRGKTPPNSRERSEFELIEVNALKGDHKHPNYSEVKKFVSGETFSSWFRNGHPYSGDVLFSTVGSIAEVAMAEGRGCIAQNIIALRPNTDTTSGSFLFYLLKNPVVKNQFMALDISSVQPSIKVPHLLNVELQWPTIREQKAIAHILGSLDDKIELNRRMNATLEGMAQALFKSWFVDFDPVIDKALAAGHPIPEPLHKRAEVRQALGEKRKPLPAAIEQYFPSRFVFNEEMGWVPEGWGSCTLANMCELITDGSHQSPKSVDHDVGLPMASSKDLTSLGIKYDTCRHISEADFCELARNGCSPIAGDVLIAKDGSRCGETCCIHSSKTPVVLLSSVAILRPKSPEYSTFINFLLSRQETITNLRDNYMSGSAIPRIVLRDFKRYPSILPTEPILNYWSSVAKSLHNGTMASGTESKYLAATRDTILPKLLSGQLRIPDADKSIGEAR